MFKNVQEEAARRKADAEALKASASSEGVNAQNMQTSDTGVQGFFGAKADYPAFTAKTYHDPNYAQNKVNVGNRIGEIDHRGPYQKMDAATTGPTAQIAKGPQDQFRGGQVGLVDALTRSANGDGPSLAQGQLQQATDQGIKQAMALAASARGVNPAVAARMAADQASATQQNAAGQSAQLRLQEQQQARQQLAGVLDQSRGADIGLATSQAGLDQQGIMQNATFQQQANANNLQSGVQQQQQRDDLVQKYLSMGMSLDQANMQAEIQQKQWNAGALNQAVAASKGVSTANSAQGTQLAGAGIGAAGALIAALA